MKANVNFSQITNQLVTIFRSEGKTVSYNSANEYREMFCGWCGYMSPLSRPAFVADFGADVVEEAEKEARRIIAEAAAARRSRYESKCKKWAKYMTEVTEYAEAEKRALQANGWRSEEAKAARRKLHSVRRANIMAMCRAAFPGVKFSVKQHDGWGADWCVTWQDGPTEEEFNKATDLDLFATYRDTFDGMTDCADTVAEEFTDFAVKYMDKTANAVEASREISKERQAEAVARVLEVAPELDKKDTHGYYERVNVTDELATKLQKAFGLSRYDLFGGYGWTTANSIARTICDNTDYTPRNENEKETTPEQPTTKAEGLQVVDYSEKAVAVVGDTKPHAGKLKELGGRFNARLKCGAGWIFSKKKEAAVRAAFGL